MNSQTLSKLLSASCVAVMITLSPALAQDKQKPFEPEYGQQGKDVVWVPTAQALVDRMLDMGKVTPKDFLMDLGSGDGRTVITAAKRGVRAMGVEFNPDMVALSKKNAIAAGVADKAKSPKASSVLAAANVTDKNGRTASRSGCSSINMP